jgi:hypothetical protein
MSSGAEDRLRDALNTYRSQVRASPNLWSRIERSMAKQRRAQRRRWVGVAAAVGAVAAVVTAVVVVNGPASGGHANVATSPATIGQFVAQANQACDDFTSGGPNPEVVFSTPRAYTDAADQLTAKVRAWVYQVDVEVPPAAQAAVDTLVADAGTIAADAGRMRSYAAAGDLKGAAGSLRAADAAITDAGNALAAVGAQECQQL